MSEQIKAFIFGFTNAFQPINYSQNEDVGKISKRINNRITANRGLTIGKIDEVTKKSSK